MPSLVEEQIIALKDDLFDHVYNCLNHSVNGISRIRFPTWSEIYMKFKDLPFSKICTEEGYFTKKFLRFFFKYMPHLRRLIRFMTELKLHLLIQTYLPLLP